MNAPPASFPAIKTSGRSASYYMRRTAAMVWEAVGEVRMDMGRGVRMCGALREMAGLRAVWSYWNRSHRSGGKAPKSVVWQPAKTPRTQIKTKWKRIIHPRPHRPKIYRNNQKGSVLCKCPRIFPSPGSVLTLSI